MSDYHGWTHAPKEQGGTDPIPLPPAVAGGEQPYAYIEWIGGYPIPANAPYNLSPSAGVGNDLGDLESWSTAGSGYHSDPALVTADYLNGRIAIFGTNPGVTRGMWLAQLAVNFGENWDNGDLYATINWGGTASDLQGWWTMSAYGKTQGAANRLTLDEMVICTSLVTISYTTQDIYVTGSLMHKGLGGAAGTYDALVGTAPSRVLDQVSLTVQKLATYPAANGAFVP